jgi:hypothetical protein
MTLDKILIFGASSCELDCFLRYAGRAAVLGFIDNDIEKSDFEGHAVYLPSEISNLPYDKIIIASTYFREIYFQLTHDLNVADETITFFYPSILSVDEFKSFSSISISHSVTSDKVDSRVLLEMLDTLLN